MCIFYSLFDEKRVVSQISLLVTLSLPRIDVRIKGFFFSTAEQIPLVVLCLKNYFIYYIKEKVIWSIVINFFCLLLKQWINE